MSYCYDLHKYCLIHIQRSVVEVVWNGLSSKNVYRIGHAGKVREYVELQQPGAFLMKGSAVVPLV